MSQESAYARRAREDPEWHERQKAKSREAYHRNPDAAKKRAKRWSEANPEKRREYGREYARRHREADPEEYARRAREYWHRHRETKADQRKNWALQTDHDITLEEYRELERMQNGVCAICGGPPDRRWLCVDHDHVTGAIRGLLCHGCNIGLGAFRDDAACLKSAMEYLDGC